MASITSLKDSHLESICNFLGDTNEGLTGSEIGKFLNRLEIEDGITSTKRIRLYEALSTRQRMDGCANKVIEFIQVAMEPISYVGAKDFYEKRRGELNALLAFAGYRLSENGSINIISKVSTLSEAEKRADRIRYILKERGVHLEVLKFCKPELVEKNYFHAVFEATKSIADRIRTLTGLTNDGSRLVDDAFSLGKTGMPYLALNMLTQDSEKSEQNGFINLIKGIFGVFRNTTAHIPKIKWEINEADALDLLTMASYVHRRLDTIHKTPLCR